MNKVRLMLLFLYLFLCLMKVSNAAKILIIESYHAEFQWDIEY